MTFLFYLSIDSDIACLAIFQNGWLLRCVFFTFFEHYQHASSLKFLLFVRLLMHVGETTYSRIEEHNLINKRYYISLNCQPIGAFLLKKKHGKN